MEADGAPWDAKAEVQCLRGELRATELVVVCVLGDTNFQNADSEALVKVLAAGLGADSALKNQVCFITGGMSGVQETFAKNCGDGAMVWNLLPVGQSSGFAAGADLHAGQNLEQRNEVFGLLGDLYVTVEGGPGVAQEARAAYARGAGVVPLARTGGASCGSFDFPSGALARPEFASDEQWRLLANSDASVVDSAAAAAAIVAAFVDARSKSKQQGQSIWEVLDELVSLRRGTLTLILSGVLLLLACVSGAFIYAEVARDRLDLALLHGGFLLLVFGLMGSVAWVLAEASRLETQGAAAEDAGKKQR